VPTTTGKQSSGQLVHAGSTEIWLLMDRSKTAAIMNVEHLQRLMSAAGEKKKCEQSTGVM